MYRARAAREIRAATDWYSQNVSAGASLLEHELRMALHRALDAHQQGVVSGTTAEAGVRRLFLLRVRYFVYFRFEANGNLNVLRVTHERQQNR